MKKIVVTGGSGFLGKALARRLSQEGHQVVTLSRRLVPEFADEGITSLSCDLTSLETPSSRQKFEEALEGAHALFHVAAKVDSWGQYDEFHRANVVATETLLRTARQQRISHFIFTSSPSVVSGVHDLKGVDESCPYPDSYLAYYPQTKAVAEKEVLSAHSPELRTIALRPHLIFGPGDTHLFPIIVDKGKTGKLKIIGKGNNLTDVCFIDDCVEAHLCALRALERTIEAGGKPYFISQGDPVPLWWFVNEVLQAHGISQVTKKVPFSLAYGLASLAEKASQIFPSLGEPFLTRFLVAEMATSHYFSLDNAKKELQFSPRYSVREALAKTFEAEGISQDDFKKRDKRGNS